MGTLKPKVFAAAKISLVALTAVASLGIALSALSPGVAGAAGRDATARAAAVAARHASVEARQASIAARQASVKSAAVARRNLAKAAKAGPVGSSGSAQIQVCDVAGTNTLDNTSLPFIEGNWTGTFYTAYSLTAGAAPGGCGPTYSFSPGSQVLVEQGSSPGVISQNVNSTFKTSGPGSIAGTNAPLAFVAVTVNAGLTVLTVTSTSTDPPGNGTLELCKTPGDSHVQGSFNFTITGAGFSKTQGVQTNQCNDFYNVPAENLTITEQNTFPYALSSVSAIPSAGLVSSDLDTQSAVVSIIPNASTTVFFTNVTLTGYAKVCKTLDRSEDNVLAGQTFTFSASATFDGAPIAVPSSVSVVAGDYGETTCAFLANGATPVALPLGSQVTFTETGLPPTIQSVGTSVSPANLDAGSSTSSASLYVGNLPAPNNVGNLGAGSVTQATFTNEAFGYVEVCKTSSSIQIGKPFQFSIGGVPSPQTVEVGYCSQGFLLPAGTTTVAETPQAHVSVTSITSTSGAMVAGDSALVTVPYDSENIVTFNNEINDGTLKLCMAQTSSDAGLENTTFDVSYSYVHNGTTVSGPVYGLEPGQCTLPIDNVPVLNSNLSPIQISVTQSTTPVANIGLFQVTVTGGDTVVSSPVPPTHFLSTPSGTPATVVINSLEGVTNVTFVNGIDIGG